MGPFHIPWEIVCIYLLGIVCVPVAIELLLHSKWWEKHSDYYHSFNKDISDEDKGKEN